MEDFRRTTKEPAEPQIWIDDNFQRVLKKLVHSLIDAENQLSALQDRKQKLESPKSEEKVSKCLKFSSVAAKGRNAERLQQTFDSIIREAESKLLDATIEANSNRRTAVKRWLLRRKAESRLFCGGMETFIPINWPFSRNRSRRICEIRKVFADYFYFECPAKRTSKRGADSIQKVNKAAKNTGRMEAWFTVNEESINDLVDRAIQREVSKPRA